MALKQIVRNQNNDPGSLLDRARAMRIEAARAMEAAQKATSEDARAGLAKQAASLLEQALGLEQRAFTVVPPPQAQKHANPQQMQQAQLAPGTAGDDDEKPERSK
ncbi:MAG: hypothetical protein KF889_18255 [Alphaproteobacteria bacterium]|nr:hypothetical protein [Alphaproteobacteria bacterium]MCW5743989.1 hypothetical protein [Alphaproteobacteria bacterium]